MEKGYIPRYAVRLLVLTVVVGAVFFAVLRLFIPEGSRLTGSYDAASLRYIAAAPVSYRGSESCSASGCHRTIFTKWIRGAHGRSPEQSKCEVCHGPKSGHPERHGQKTMDRSFGDLTGLCLSCHRRMKARESTQQPQINAETHPFPHQGVLECRQCHDPHSPSIKTSKKSADASNGVPGATAPAQKENETSETKELVTPCAVCHGPTGRGGFAPQLAGMAYQQLQRKLRDFRSGKVKAQVMNGIARDLSDREIERVARYFSEAR